MSTGMARTSIATLPPLWAASLCTDRSNVIDHADLVVDVHDADDERVGTQHIVHLPRLDDAIWARIQIRHLETLGLEIFAGVQHGLVLDGAGHDVPFHRAVGNSFDCQVVGLRRAGGPHDFPRIGVDELCDLGPGMLHRLLGLPAVDVGARRRIAEISLHQQAGTHFLGDPRIHRGGRGVIQIDGLAHQISRASISWLS
jgi:hypothetical protein